MNLSTVFRSNSKWLAVVAAVNGFLVVALGAFGAHGLTNLVPAAELSYWQTGVRYHMFHVIAILASGFCGSGALARRWAAIGGWLFVAGIALFCGSMYLLAAQPMAWLSWVAPVGGVAFLAGWGALSWALIID